MSLNPMPSRCVAWALLMALGCDTSARRPPGPAEAVLPPPAASAEAPAAEEELGFAAEVVAEPAAPPGKPSGSSSIGRFALAENARFTAILEELRAAITKNKGKLHAVVIDLELGRALVLHRATEPLNPASNMKLLTAAAALDLLGPAHTFRTELFADIDAKGRAAQLVVRGGGDPALSSSDLFRLAESAVAQGLREVGRIEVDQSLFATPFVPPAFASQPHEWAAFRAPISALAVAGNAVALQVAPTEPGQAARVWYDPPGVVTSEGRIETRASGTGDRVTWSLDPTVDPQLPASKVGGGLAAGLGRQRYTRRLEDPRRAPGLVLAHFLSLLGVKVEAGVEVRASGAAALPSRLTYVASAPLAELLRPLGKDSDNFTAEMMLVALSASLPEGERSWSTERGATALRGWLESGGIPLQGVSITNGSGLFDANRLTAETLALVLARMEGRPEVFAEYLAQLSVYGTDGTLRRRMAGSEERSRIRAKTGTLARVDALSGYVLRAGGLRPIVFSLVVTETSAHSAVRQALDRAVFDWAKAAEQP